MRPIISGIPFLVYPVRDMAQAKGFYRGGLGLTAGQSWEGQWGECEVGTATRARKPAPREYRASVVLLPSYR
jgi:catechol 2,3-dioxygenase-like lactoylglutathione lyase family enzyme